MAKAPTPLHRRPLNRRFPHRRLPRKRPIRRQPRGAKLDLARSLSEAPPGDLRRDFLLALADLPPEFWPKLADFMEEILARRADDPGT